MNTINVRPDGTKVVKKDVPPTSTDAKDAVKMINNIIGNDGLTFIANKLRKEN